MTLINFILETEHKVILCVLMFICLVSRGGWWISLILFLVLCVALDNEEEKKQNTYNYLKELRQTNYNLYLQAVGNAKDEVEKVIGVYVPARSTCQTDNTSYLSTSVDECTQYVKERAKERIKERENLYG